ncbi:MAG: MFS transporter [Euryarchaeota archaeon]|nr:MFS transporter [Euryarchaeota archaeon]
MNHQNDSRSALGFVILLGVVSLFADLTYEGARSITGQYLGLLGASAFAIGAVAGLGELVGYGLRLVSGYLSDRTGRYWAITILGYAVNLLAVPLLALAGRWEVAALLIIAERFGKSIRVPARDAMLSHATSQTGRGWGFGLHEALDQVGAVLGPLVVAGVIYLEGDYAMGFAVLLVPALMALAVLLAARLTYPRPQVFEARGTERGELPRSFWLYLPAVALIAAGYVDFPLVAYHFTRVSTVPEEWIPVFYSIAMGSDALAALALGRLFDRFGLPVLAVSALVSSLFAPLVFFGGLYPALLGMVLWGVGMGAQESVMRAAVAGMVPADRRGTAYGIFNAGYGLAWFVGSALMGALYGVSLTYLVVFSVAAQLASVPVFARLGLTRGS